MFKLTNIFQKKDASIGVNNTLITEVETKKHWYEERYNTIVIQRNILALVLFISLIIMIISVISTTIVATSKAFDPFVIQIDQQTGAAKIVNPVTTELLGGNQALDKYFIKKYVSARETYNPVDFVHAKSVVKLLSSPSVFFNYLGYIRDKNNDPTIIYGQNNTTYMTVKSWSQLDPKTYILRFATTETSGAMRVANKIAVVSINYVAMELDDDAARDINPIGFQVTGYRVDDDNS